MLTLTGNGRLTRAVELRTTRGGESVATVSVASDRRDRKADPVYVDLIVWRGQAEAAAQHLVKGQAVAFTGRFEPRGYTTRDGRRASPTSCTTSRSSTAPSPAATSPRPWRPSRRPRARPTLTTSPSRASRRGRALARPRRRADGYARDRTGCRGVDGGQARTAGGVDRRRGGAGAGHLDGGGADRGAAATCADYPNQAAAQKAADTRDPDGDGVYCEDLPCPCSTDAGGGDGDGDGGQEPDAARAAPSRTACSGSCSGPAGTRTSAGTSAAPSGEAGRDGWC